MNTPTTKMYSKRSTASASAAILDVHQSFNVTIVLIDAF